MIVQLLLQGEPLLTPAGAIAPIEAVLFDKDGTLSHSEPMLQALASARIERGLTLFEQHHPQTAASQHGLPPRTRQRLQALLEQTYGLSDSGLDPGGITAVAARDHNLIATATVFTQVGLSWPDALHLAELSFADTDALHGAGAPNPPRPTEGLHPLIQRLRGSGLRCAVISNDHTEGIEAFLENHGLADDFEALWSADDHPRKPDAGAVHGLCALLGVAAGRCALIGDADSDLRMARAAGVPVVLGYRAGWRSPPRLESGSLELRHWDELSAMPLER